MPLWQPEEYISQDLSALFQRDQENSRRNSGPVGLEKVGGGMLTPHVIDLLELAFEFGMFLIFLVWFILDKPWVGRVNLRTWVDNHYKDMMLLSMLAELGMLLYICCHTH